MAHRSKNLLEAFQASGAAPAKPASSPPPAQPASSATPQAPAPAASAAPPAPRAAPAPTPAPAPRPPGVPAAAVPPPPAPAPTIAAAAPFGRSGPFLEQLKAWRPTQAQRLIGLGVLIALAFFFLGRASVGRVEAGAAEPGEASPASAPGNENAAGLGLGGAGVSQEKTPPSAPAAAAQPGDGFSAVEQALRDPRNKYTIKLVEYVAGKDEALAGHTLQYLQAEGLPAAAVKYKGRLSILLGAGASRGELDGLLERARTMNGPPPRSKPREFFDAYLESIDNVFARGQ